MTRPQQAAPRAGQWRYIPVLLALAVAAGLALTQHQWLPLWQRWIAAAPGAAAENQAHEHESHAGHEGAGSGNWLELSPQAQANIGLKTAAVALSDFDRTVTVPGILIERKGRSRIEITAPLTGVVTRVFPLEGEALAPDAPLFTMRLTHEELVTAQAELLRVSEELGVVRQEIERLESIAKDGGIAGKSLLERKYELQKQEVQLRSLRQALLLHGLSEEQVDTIISSRKLLGELTIRVPRVPELSMAVMQVQQVKVEHGQHVEAGAPLAVLTDHSELLIEGEAFERDSGNVSIAMAEARPVTAVFETPNGQPEVVGPLAIQSVASRVAENSRALHFYVNLSNRLRHDTGEKVPHRFVDWHFKPGQRVQIRLPVERWKGRIVVPLEALAHEGVEAYAFRVNGNRFERQSVHVEFQDPLQAVLVNDGSLFPGETIAISSAHQLNLALKNKAGGGVDPHAGHTH